MSNFFTGSVHKKKRADARAAGILCQYNMYVYGLYAFIVLNMAPIQRVLCQHHSQHEYLIQLVLKDQG